MFRLLLACALFGASAAPPLAQTPGTDSSGTPAASFPETASAFRAEASGALPASNALTPCAESRVRPPASVFAFNRFGSPLNTPEKDLAEGDSATIHVYVNPALEGQLRIQRTTPAGDGEAFRFAGVPDAAFRTSSFRDPDAVPAPALPACGSVGFTAHDLSGGRVSFVIEYFRTDGDAPSFVKLGEFSLPVTRRYAGIATFGVVASFLEDRRYTLVPEDPAADSVLSRVAITEEGARFQYVLGLSPFLARRPLQPGTWSGLHLAPFVGFDMEKPFSNLYLGAHASLADVVYLTGGLHVGRVTRLPEGLTLLDGARYNGAAVPTIEPFRVGGFVGVTADARLAISALGGLIKGLAR